MKANDFKRFMECVNDVDYFNEYLIHAGYLWFQLTDKQSNKVYDVLSKRMPVVNEQWGCNGTYPTIILNNGLRVRRVD